MAQKLPDATMARGLVKGKTSCYLGLDTRLPEVDEKRWEDIAAKFPHVPRPDFDTTQKRREFWVRLPRFVEDWANQYIIRDHRDTIMLSTLVNMLFSTIPLAIYMFYRPSHAVGIASIFLNAFIWTQRFILMLHYAEHKPLFKRNVAVLRYIMPYFLAPFYGIPAGMYRSHHVVMHHRENNIFDRDLSSTEPYERNNFFHWVIYLAKYYCLFLTLPIYIAKKQRWSLLLEVGGGAVTYFGGIYLLIKNGHGLFACYTFVAPFIFSSVAMMLGNWSQHIFVHPSVATMEQKLSSPQYNCALTINCMNHVDNLYSFNDGYHIVHHAHPAKHWSDMSKSFFEDIETYAEHNPVVFQGTCFFEVGIMAFIARHINEEWGYRWLYDHYVHFSKEKRSFDDVKRELQTRLRPIPIRDNTDGSGARKSKDM